MFQVQPTKNAECGLESHPRGSGWIVQMRYTAAIFGTASQVLGFVLLPAKRGLHQCRSKGLGQSKSRRLKQWACSLPGTMKQMHDTGADQNPKLGAEAIS